jgi:hypothetical protein
MRYFLFALRVLGFLLIVHALMLIGADEISTIEAGGVRTIRSLDHILTIYRLDPKPWEASLPAMLQGLVGRVMSLPGWAVLAVLGVVIGFAARAPER